MDNQTNINTGSEEQTAPETLLDYVTAPDAPDLGEDDGAATIPPPEQSPPEVADSAAAVESEKQVGQDKATDPAPPAPEEKAPEPEKKGRGGRPPKTDEPEKSPETDKPKKIDRALHPAKQDKGAAAGVGGASGKSTAKEDAPPVAPAPEPPREAPRPNGKDEIVYLNLSELRPFKNHPFGVRDDSEMKALVESVKVGGVNQPALVRPLEDGGYEIIAGHRRQKASELAGYFEMPCIVREMTDDEAILAMTDDNLRQRTEILPSEKAASLKMQFEAIKHQGARDASGQNVPKDDVGKRSIEIVGERKACVP